MFVDHHRRRNRDQSNIGVRIDSSCREPVAKPHGVSARLECHGKDHRTALLATLLREGTKVARV